MWECSTGIVLFLSNSIWSPLSLLLSGTLHTHTRAQKAVKIWPPFWGADAPNESLSIAAAAAAANGSKKILVPSLLLSTKGASSRERTF